jgi:ATP-binding cassette, subfamily B, bacterial
MAMGEPESDGNRSPRGLRSLGPLLLPNLRLVILLIGVSIGGGVAEAGLLYAVVRGAAAIASDATHIDQKIGPLPAVTLSIPSLILVAVVLLLVSLACALLGAWATSRIAVSLLTRLRKEVFESFAKSEWSIQASQREGILQELLTTYVIRVASGVISVASGLIAACNFLALLGAAFVISPGAAAACLIAVVVLYVGLRPMVRATKKQSRRNRDENATYATQVTEAAGLIREVRVFDVADRVVDDLGTKADSAGRAFLRTRMLAQVTPEVYRNAAFLFILGGIVAVYSFGVADVANLGAVVLLLVRSLSYSQGIQSSVQQANDFAPYREALDREIDLFKQHAVSRAGAPMPAFSGLRFTHVDYEYVPGRPVLRDVSFAVDRGESIGIIGPSGSGKSTLVQLLLRLRQPTNGHYEIAGADASEFELGGFYRQFVFVPQDNRLLHGSVRDNIAFFRPSLSDADIEHAARMANLHDEIMEFEHGYGTVIGSGAADISGGQRQRLGLARALVGRPSVLVLDEPTSALDVKSESLVQRTLLDLKGEITVFVIAHRMSTLSICDRLLVLNAGRVEAFGAPSELQVDSPFFREAMQLSRLPT